MENINTLVTQISDYFKDKLLSGEYEFLECSHHTAIIKIDDKYIFEVWICNDPKNSFSFYPSGHDKTILNEEMLFTNQKDRAKAWRLIKPHIKNYTNKVLLTQKEDQLEKLKQQIQELN